MTAPDILLPPGLYYVGDPCYVSMSEADRDLEHSALFDGEYRTDPDAWSRTFTVDGSFGRFGGACTKYGDGVYGYVLGPGARRVAGTDHLSVDSGVIGAVPVTDSNWEGVIAELHLGCIVRFAEPFAVQYDKDTGIIMLGPVLVYTGDDNEDDE